jgi:hypothetical protein
MVVLHVCCMPEHKHDNLVRRLIEKFHTYVISRHSYTGFLFVPHGLTMSHLGMGKQVLVLEDPLAFHSDRYAQTVVPLKYEPSCQWWRPEQGKIIICRATSERRSIKWQGSRGQPQLTKGSSFECSEYISELIRQILLDAR